MDIHIGNEYRYIFEIRTFHQFYKNGHVSLFIGLNNILFHINDVHSIQIQFTNHNKMYLKTSGTAFVSFSP